MSRAPSVKLTKASVSSYGNSSCKHSSNGSSQSRRGSSVRPSSGSRSGSRPQSISPCCKSYLKTNNIPEEMTSSGNDDVDYLQCRVGSLRKKLDEANNNICTLRAFVVGTLVRMKNPKDPEEMAEEIKQLLCAIDDMEDHICVVLGRGVECVEVLDDLESADCTCGTDSPSLAAIKDCLAEVNDELEQIDCKLAQRNESYMGSIDEEISGTGRSSRNGSATASTQRNSAGPEQKPKILQTDTRLSVTEGTNHSTVTQSTKAQTAKPRCSCNKRIKSDNQSRRSSIC